MMVIAHIYPKDETDKNKVWDWLAEELPKIDIDYVQPLYLSQQAERDYTSIVFDASSFEAMIPVFVEALSKCEYIGRTRTSPLLEPVFFPVPKERPEDLKRYRLAIKATTDEVRSIFEQLIAFDAPVDAFPTYQAYSFGEDDILASILAPQRQPLEDLVLNSIAKWDGVLDTSLTVVNRNLRLAPQDEWREYRADHYRAPPEPSADTEFDWLDAAMSGAFVEELD